MRHNDRGIVEARPALVALYLLFALLTSLASIYVWAGHTSHVFWCAGLLLAVLIGPLGLATFVFCPAWLKTLLSSRGFWLVCVLAITATDTVRFHGRVVGPHPNTAAPALIDPAFRLAHGQDPYGVRLPDGAPISPGPGWIMLLAPLTLCGGVATLTGLTVGLCTYLVRAYAPASAGLIIVFVLVQPVLLVDSMIGHDIFAIPILFAVLCLLAEQWAFRATRLSGLAVVAAAFATSRLPMVMLLLILCVGLYRLRAKAGLLFSAVSLPLTVFLHGAFYLWARKDHLFYQPLHVVLRGSRVTNHALQWVGFFAVLSVLVSMLLAMGEHAKDWIEYGGLFLAAAFVPVGLGELRLVHPHYIIWEGANYVSFGASLLAITVALHGQSDRVGRHDWSTKPSS